MACVTCSVYGALRWDRCGVHSICSVYQVFGLVVFCPFRVFAAFRGHWGGTFVAFTALVVFLLGIGVGHWWRFSAFVVFMRDAGWSFYLIYLFFVWRGVAWRCV